MVINKNYGQDTLVNMPQSTNIASNRIYFERLGHFVPNLSQSNSSLGPGYAVGIKAKTGTIRKLYRWPGGRKRAVAHSQAFTLPRLLLRLLRLPPFFFAHADFFLLFPPMRSLVPGWSNSDELNFMSPVVLPNR